ncbi:hypothetical protein AGLY_011237 [Aphis glycines]|uniref:Reverse transcriptase domain-containing protein n=1 Tax=Aphis glycines TaxID=307491 RepID=A0A6G0TDS2_APHGL|nr:hypothetical protein AGLY_011237 [Aphis glycines]
MGIGGIKELCELISRSRGQRLAKLVSTCKKYNDKHSVQEGYRRKGNINGIIVNLGVSFDSKLSFNNHVDSIRNKSYMKLRLLKLRFHIDYASLIWHSDSICQNQSLSCIQNNFLRYLSFKYHFERRPHSGFKMLNLKFLFKLLHNLVDCPELLERINFNKLITSHYYLGFSELSIIKHI